MRDGGSVATPSRLVDGNKDDVTKVARVEVKYVELEEVDVVVVVVAAAVVVWPGEVLSTIRFVVSTRSAVESC